MTPQTPSSHNKPTDLHSSIIDIDPASGQVPGEISEIQTKLFSQAMEEARRQIERIDADMQVEIARTREKLLRLQATKKRYLSIFQDAAQILGITTTED